MKENFNRTKQKVLELLDNQEKGTKLIRQYLEYLEEYVKVLEKINNDYKKLLDKFTQGGKGE